MSYWTELFVGDADSIGPDLQCDKPPVPDLELPGILPQGDEFGNTLEVFTEAVCKTVGRPVIRFRDYVGRRVAGDEDESVASFGANVMSREWVHLVGGLSGAQREAAARTWVKEWDPGADVAAETVALDLVESICNACARAASEASDLICAWSL